MFVLISGAVRSGKSAWAEKYALGIAQGRLVYLATARVRDQEMAARVRRHQSVVKKMHWHIDYLLAAPGVCVREVLRRTEGECTVNQQVSGAIQVPGFGASDCRAGCVSHLKRVR